MANVDTGKKQLHDKTKAWAEILCQELAYEEVMQHPEKYMLVEQVKQELREIGFLPQIGGLYEGQSALEDELVVDRINATAFRIDGARERHTQLEGVFLGVDLSLIGTRNASAPNDPLRRRNGLTITGDNNQPRRFGDLMPDHAHVWKFKADHDTAARAYDNSSGKGLFQHGWLSQEHMAVYFKAVLDDNLDSDQPEYVAAFEIASIYREFWDDTKPYKYTQQRLQGSSWMNEISVMTGRVGHSSAPTSPSVTGDYADEASFFYRYGDAFKALYDFVVATGYFDPACVETRAKMIAGPLAVALGLEIRQVQRELERGNAVSQAIRGAPTPPPPKVRNLKPFDFQCFLIENISKLSKRQGKLEANYSNVLRLKSMNNPGTLISRIQHGARHLQVEQMLNICPEVYALLTPYIRLYRVDYDKKNPTIPISQQEIQIPNYMDPSDVTAITESGGGRYRGYGIKSFSWKLAGVQPAEVDNNITADLSFYFQTIGDLFQGAKQAGIEGKTSPLDLIISSRASELVEKNRTNTSVGAKPKSCALLRDTMNELYAGASYRIKATIGWNAPPNFKTALPGFSQKVPETQQTKGELLLEAIRDTQLSLFLQQTRHKIDFKEDGSVELGIQYQAALSGILKEEKANILADDKTFFKDEVEIFEERLSTERARGDGADQKKIKDLLDDIEALKVQSRMFKYKRFLNKLYGMAGAAGSTGAACDASATGPSKIYTISVSPAELLIPPWSELTAAQRASRAKRRMGSTEERGWHLGNPSDPTAFDESLLETVTEVSRDPDSEEDELNAQAEGTKERFEAFARSDEDIQISYFYLGDLIDTILDGLPGYGGGKKFQFFLADMELLNPLLAFQMSNLAEVLCTDNVSDATFLDALRKSDPLRFGTINNIVDLINIGDVPISLDAFNVWFKDNVVKPGKDYYYFLYFIKDICSQLISNALAADCFGTDVKFDIRFDAAAVDIKTGLKAGSTVSVNQVALKKGAVKASTSPKDIVPALIIYSTDSKPKKRKGNYLDDLTDGIYHHYVGSACGLVKRINFVREDQPFLREAKIQKVGALGAEQLRELYSVQLDLMGSTLYKNGQYIYVDPTMVGSDKTMARKLGISGYYMITSVNHTINDAGYDVQIRALQQGISFADDFAATSPHLLEGLTEETPTYTPLVGTQEDRDIAAGDSLDAGVAAASAGVAATMDQWKEALGELADGDLGWDDIVAAVRLTPLAGGITFGAAAYAEYKRARGLQDAPEEALDAAFAGGSSSEPEE